MKDLECIGCTKGQKKGIIYRQIIITIQQKGQQSLCPITMGLVTDPQQTNFYTTSYMYSKFLVCVSLCTLEGFEQASKQKSRGICLKDWRCHQTKCKIK